MAITRVACPECGAGLKSPTGFKVGQNVCCPKCETYFEVEDPADEEPATGKKRVQAAVADDEEFDPPTKKKKKKPRDDEDSERSYKNSPIRYVILGVLVCVMIGLGVMLYLKKRDESRQNENTSNTNSNVVAPTNILPPPKDGPLGGGVGGGRPNRGGGIEVSAPPMPKKNNQGGGLSLGGFFGGGNLSSTESTSKLQEYRDKLHGTWIADLGDGKTSTIVYKADGTFTDNLTTVGTPVVVTGQWATGVLLPGNKGIRITRIVNGKQAFVRAEFEGEELIHETQERGIVGTFRKK
ncbi:MAG TPA: hypothetical protein VLM40_21210 [Gemmata sp.]|nr:hypothetical protein [Gemmata sp.]